MATEFAGALLPLTARAWSAVALRSVPAAALVLLSTYPDAHASTALDREAPGSPFHASPAAMGERAQGSALPAQDLRDDEAARAALERGLVFLAGQQALEGDGSFPAGERERWSPVGITAVGVLAFLAAGNTATRGPHSAQVEAGLSWLLDRVSPASANAPGYIYDEGNDFSRMHGHGLATLALAEAYGMSPEHGEAIAAALVAAVACIERAQSNVGGWYYEPESTSEHEGSVTICIVQALRAAKDAGILVDSGRIALAIDYVKRLQQENGAFAYTLGTPDKTSVALTGAGLATLHATGVYTGREVDDAYDWLWRTLAARDDARAAGNRSLDSEYPCYERFYLAQALWQNPDEDQFRGWYEKEKKEVLQLQQKDGSWPARATASANLEGPFGPSYATAMNCLFLALPDGYLPIFQR